jgi:hypothetical protein|tara:strand:- start:1794 stop:2207 length:414 start_codon:yes stop_codon:yes gene_type:complete
MVHKAYVILPKDIGSLLIECDDCSINYRVEDYKTLYFSKKICYFFLPEEEEEPTDHSFTFDIILCHQCLFKYLKKTTSQTSGPLTVLIIDEGKGYHITVDPDDIDSNADEWMDNFDDLFDDDDDDDDEYDFLDPPKY